MGARKAPTPPAPRQVKPIPPPAPPRKRGRLVLSEAEWRAEAVRRFGPDEMGWQFVCPCCGHVASVSEWRAGGAEPGAVGFSCVGRWVGAKREAFGGQGAGPCNYAGGGLFSVNPVCVTSDTGQQFRVFDFAPEASRP